MGVGVRQGYMTGNQPKGSEKEDFLEQRKKLSFKAAEGLVPLPAQLALGEITQEFRAVVWAHFHTVLEAQRRFDGHAFCLAGPWLVILRDAHVYHHHRPIDEFSTRHADALASVKGLILSGKWSDVLGWLEFVLKHPSCPDGFAKEVNSTMEYCHLAYGVFDAKVICPIGSTGERQSLERAFADLAATEFHGARAHLRKAAEELTAGHYSYSVRESVHAVEAIARVLEPSAALSSALGRLEKSAKVHPALKSGFNNIYGYTSDEKGIRHPLLDDGTAKVDQTDALFMIGACAAFVSYLINKGHAAGLL